jgi:hypothetical protein
LGKITCVGELGRVLGENPSWRGVAASTARIDGRSGVDVV